MLKSKSRIFALVIVYFLTFNNCFELDISPRNIYEQSGTVPLVQGLGFTIPLVFRGYGIKLKYRGDLVGGYTFPISVDDSTNLLTINPTMYVELGLNLYAELQLGNIQLRLVNETPGFRALSDFLFTLDLTTKSDICYGINANAAGPQTKVTFEGNVNECQTSFFKTLFKKMEPECEWRRYAPDISFYEKDFTSLAFAYPLVADTCKSFA